MTTQAAAKLCIRCKQRPPAKRTGARICAQCFSAAIDTLFAEADAQLLPITGAQLEEIGQLADQANNLVAASQLPVSAHIHIEGMSGGLVSIRNALQKLYVEIAGDDPWKDMPDGNMD